MRTLVACLLTLPLFADAPQRFDALIERFAQRVEREKAAEKKPRAKTPKDAPSADRA